MAALVWVGVGAGAAEVPAAAAEPQFPVIVSFNGVATSDYGPDPRAQTYTAVLDNGSLSDGISVHWGPPDDEKQSSVGIGASKKLPLHLGVLTAVGTDGPRTEEHDIYGDELGMRGGEIDVLDLTATRDGRITRFDIVLSAPGGGGRFGELRMGEPETGSLSPTARLLQWPLIGREAPALPTLDRFRNVTEQTLTVGQARVHGGASRDYTIKSDDCSGAVLAPGQTCTITASFTPRQGGPRVSTLVLPTSKDAVRVPLSGSAPLGSSKVIIDGSIPVRSDTWAGSYSPLTVIAGGGIDPAKPSAYYLFTLDETGRQSRRNPIWERMQLAIDSDKGPLSKGTYKVNQPNSPYSLGLTARNDSCSSISGSMKVHRFTVDAHNQPTYADIDFDQRCLYSGVSSRVKAHLSFQVRADTSAPSKPTALKVRGRKITWKTSKSHDLQTTIVRLQPGKWSTPTSGLLLNVGAGKSAVLPSLPAGTTWTVSAFSVDKTGNASKPRQVAVHA